MTKFQKQMLTIAAAGALTAVTALPAMAFENQFNGTFALKTYLSNYENGYGSANVSTRDKSKANNFTDQRLRLNYTAKASDDLKLVVQLEANTQWGVTKLDPTAAAVGASTAAANGNSQGLGGGVDTDAFNLAVRHAYLDFNIGKSVNVKVGQQSYQDLFKGLYAGSIDLPMLQVAYKQGGYALNLGFSRFNDTQAGLSGNTFKGDQAADLYLIENTYALNKDTKVGLGYYLNVDNTAEPSTKKINTLGLAAQTKLAGIDLSGFAAMQTGFGNGATRVTYQGWAANVAAKTKLGNGVAKSAFLFASGDNKVKAGFNGAWQTISAANNSVAQNSYVESGMMLLVRNPAQGGTNTDAYLRKPVTNVALLTLGYDANLTEKLALNSNVGFAWLPASDYRNAGTTATTGTTKGSSTYANGSDFMGTELNLEAAYKLYNNLTLKAQAAYVVLGGAYKDTAKNVAGTAADPTNPWTMRLGAFYSF